jgi:hypothetical protein
LQFDELEQNYFYCFPLLNTKELYELYQPVGVINS